MVDMSETLQEEATLMSSRNYVSGTGRNVSVSDVENVKQGSEYTHILTLAISKNTKPCSETISFAPPAMPTWVDKVNDDSGSDIRKNMDKTTGIKYLIKGVSDAYKDYTNLATIDFKIKNN